MIATPTPTTIEIEVALQEATLTPTTSPTPQPSPTATIEPSSNQNASPIATARKILRLGNEDTLEEGGFSYRPPIGYMVRYQFGQVTLTSDDGDTVLSLIGGRSIPSEDRESDLMNFADLISDNFQELVIGTPYQFQIENAEGVATNVEGLWDDNEISGRLVVVVPDDEQIFYALAISSSNPSGSGWEPEGRQAFEAVLNSVTFFPPVEPEE